MLPTNDPSISSALPSSQPSSDSFDATQFNSQLSDLSTKYDAHNSIAADVVGGAVATVGDYAASTWNSLPFTENVDTRDVLSRIDSNALRVYQENPATIQALSLIGGSLIPGLGSLKLLNAARMGMKGVNWFSEAGKIASIAKVDSLFAEGVQATEAYNAARRMYWARTAANVAVDQIAMEAAITGTMNAHPYMDDYNKDFMTNFVSGVLTSPFAIGFQALGHVAARFEVAAKEIGVAQKAAAILRPSASEGAAGIKEAEQVDNLSAQVATRASNVKTWEDILKSGAPITGEGPVRPLDQFTKEMAQSFILSEKAAMWRTFDDMVSPEIRGMDKTFQANLLQRVVDDPAKFAGVNSIEFLKPKDTSILSQAKAKLFGTSEDLSPGDLPLTKTTPAGIKGVKAVYSPEDDAFYYFGDQKSFARAVDLGYTEKNLTDGIPKNWSSLNRTDFSTEALSKGTATLDAEYLKAIKYFDDMSDDQFIKASHALSPDDLPMMQGAYIRAAKLAETNPEAAKEFKIIVTENTPNWEKIQTQAAARQGVTPEYLQSLKDVEANYGKYNLHNGSRSTEARIALNDWIGGKAASIARLRKAADDYFRGGYGANSSTASKGIIEEMYKSPESTALRNTLAKNADSDGYIYLYRGLHKKAFGHNSIDSYTTNPVKAAEHASRGGNVQLYKVRPEEILGAIKDLAGNNSQNNYEILVMSPTRETGTLLEKGKEAVSDIVDNNTAVSSIHKNVTELGDILKSKKLDEVQGLLAQGVPLQTIGLRTNMPLDSVKAYAISKDAEHLVTNAYASAEELGQYLSPERRGLAIRTNMNKVPFAQLKSQIQVTSGQNMQTMLLEDVFRGTQSQIISRVADLITSPIQKGWVARIRQGLPEIVSQAVGGKFLQSSDFALRKLGDLGVVISQSGKNFTEATNKLAEELLTPLSNRMAAIAKDRAAQTEFNTAINIEATIKGYKTFDRETGMWMKQDEITPWNILKDANGKTIGKERNLVPVEYNGSKYQVVTPNVIDTIDHMSQLGREFYEMNKTLRTMRGMNPMSDIGFWRPAMNPRDKHISYVFNKNTLETTMLYGKNEQELAEAVSMYKAAHPEELSKGMHEIIDKSQQARYNEIQGRHDPIFMNAADANMLRTGSSSLANVPTNAEILSELMGGYDHYIGYGVRRTFMDYNSDIFQHLERLSDLAGHGISDQPLSIAKKLTKTSNDAGSVIRNTLLGASNLKEYQGWKSANDLFTASMESSLNFVAKVLEPITQPTKAGISSLLGKKTSDEQWLDLMHEMEARGIRSPWEDISETIAKERFQVDNMAKIPGIAPRVIALGNAISATMLLRVGELAQAATNLISLPILMSSAVGRQYSEKFLSGTLKGDESFLGIKTMFNGIRRMNDPQFAKFTKYAEDHGIFKPIISEVNDILHKIYSFNPDSIKTIENSLDSKAVQLLSKPGDISESFVRKWAFHTGIELATTTYKGLNDIGKITFARNFVDEVVGNYSAAQRPVVFQGNLGVAMGLFQTYIVTYAQSLFRNAEIKDWKNLSKQMLYQGGIFGAQSLPGFNQVSEYIGEHYSNNHLDLNTGTYRALDSKLADLIMFGLPSNIAPTFTTRGDVAPRIPNIVGGLQNLPTINILASAVQSSNRLLQAAIHTDDNTFQAIGEALSLQSLSRPIARLSELAVGHSITSKGNEVAGPDEVRSFQGIAARIFATRPVQEMKLREALHLNTVYNTVDHDNQEAVTERLKTHIRNGDLNPEVVSQLAEKYLRTGTPGGWRSSVNSALAQVNDPGNAVRNHLKPTSSLNTMIDDMD